MKRLRLLPILLLLFGLTGCIKEYTLKEEQSDAVAEYMAGKLLEYEDTYEQDLVLEDELMEAGQEDSAQIISPTAVAENPSSDSNNTEGTIEETDASIDYSLAEVIGVEDFDIQYKGYTVTETYPEDSDSTYFSLTARKGNQLLAVAFDLKNTTKSKKTLNLSKSKVLYQLDINVDTIYKPSLTLLENDLQYIDISVAGGKTEQVLLIFEVAKTTDLSDVNLIVSKDKKTKIIKII